MCFHLLLVDSHAGNPAVIKPWLNHCSMVVSSAASLLLLVSFQQWLNDASSAYCVKHLYIVIHNAIETVLLHYFNTFIHMLIASYTVCDWSKNF